jgi:hypothetical protein
MRILSVDRKSIPGPLTAGNDAASIFAWHLAVLDRKGYAKRSRPGPRCNLAQMAERVRLSFARQSFMIRFLTDLISFEAQRSGAFLASGQFIPCIRLPRSNTYSGGAGAAENLSDRSGAIHTPPRAFISGCEQNWDLFVNHRAC